MRREIKAQRGAGRSHSKSVTELKVELQLFQVSAHGSNFAAYSDGVAKRG